MSIVNLENLRGMTGGDAALEARLFKEFHRSFEAGLVSLDACLLKNENNRWQRETHALKGIAINLGAEHLAELCKEAQELNDDELHARKTILDSIRVEHEAVRIFLTAASA